MGVSSLLPSCESQQLKLGCKAWQPFTTDISMAPPYFLRQFSQVSFRFLPISTSIYLSYKHARLVGIEYQSVAHHACEQTLHKLNHLPSIYLSGKTTLNVIELSHRLETHMKYKRGKQKTKQCSHSPSLLLVCQVRNLCQMLPTAHHIFKIYRQDSTETSEMLF